jgi:hypothetical protein
MAADDRRAPAIPIDTELDPAILLAARELRAGLTRVHPSFRFEESLAARLAAGAGRLEAGLPVEETPSAGRWGTVAPFRSHGSAAPAALTPEIVAAPAARSRGTWSAAAFRRLPEKASRPSRQLVGGVGVGVAGAALSLGAVYVAWRYSHPASGRMGRAVKAAHSRSAHSGQGRRTGVIHGILGVVS